MNTKIILVILVCVLITGFSWASSKAPLEEDQGWWFALKEEDFTRDDFNQSFNLISEKLEDYRQGKEYDFDATENCIGIPNSLLRLRGYAFLLERDNFRLQLENARLKKGSAKDIAGLKASLDKAEHQLKDFFESNHWVD